MDEHYLRIALKEAVRARARGNHAFGALLTGAWELLPSAYNSLT